MTHRGMFEANSRRHAGVGRVVWLANRQPTIPRLLQIRVGLGQLDGASRSGEHDWYQIEIAVVLPPTNEVIVRQ